ncbi:MAG: hypothetical protein WC765_00150 [Phycisphaerae bacterium]
MKKEYVLAILFFGGLWGLNESLLGNALYSANIPMASVPVTVIGFVILAFARVYFPQRGLSTLIAAFAMLYKFLNAPFFACHLLGILLLGMAFDLFFSTGWLKNRALAAAAAVYVGNAAFAILLAYVVRYHPWVEGGTSKVLRHIFLNGTVTAVLCAVVVPLAFHYAEAIKARLTSPFALRLRPVSSSISLVTLCMWVFGVLACITRF